MATKKAKKKYNRYGEGSVYLRSSDGRWVTKYKAPGATKHTWCSSKTEKIANEKLKELKRLAALGVQASNQTIADLMQTWLETFKKSKLAPASYDTDETAYLCHIEPTLGDYQAQQVTDVILQQLINQKNEELAHKTLSRVYSLLKNFFKYLATKKIIEEDPMIIVGMPKERYTKDNPIHYLELDEIKRMEDAVEEQVRKAWATGKWAKNIVARYGYIVLFLLNTGLRKGEMLALGDEDLWDDQKLINIDESLGLIKNRNRKEGENKYIWNWGPPKSKSGIRLVMFNKKARYYIREIKRIQKHLDYADQKYIARTPAGEPLSKSTWTNLLKQICKLAKIDKPISPHELRHTYATVCISKGIDVFVVSKQMGHSSIEQTYRYVHLLKNVVQQADQLLEDLIPDNSTSEGVTIKGTPIKDLIPTDLVVNGVPLKDLIPENLVA